MSPVRRSFLVPVWAIVLLLPVVTVPSAVAGATSVPGGGVPPTGVAEAGLLALPTLLGDDHYVGRVILAQLARQGTLNLPGPASLAPLPPGIVYHDVRPTCDLDGDGRADLLVNELALSAPPGMRGAFSTLVARSTLDGAMLWRVENAFHPGYELDEDARSESPWEPRPSPPGSAGVVPDGDGDGVCDILALGARAGEGVQAPIYGSPSVSRVQVAVRLISGATGAVVWSQGFEPVTVEAAEPLYQTATTYAVQNIPTGFLTFPAPGGVRFVLKTTDLVYAQAHDWLGATTLPLLGDRGIFQEPLEVRILDAVDRVSLADAESGHRYWTREFRTEQASPAVNLTWLGGVEDLDGDAEPEILLNQLLVGRARFTEPDAPGVDRQAFYSGRGMAVAALRGDPAAQGEDLWSRLVLDSALAQPDPPVEGSTEVLMWTGVHRLVDLTGDGRPEVLAAYLARETRGEGSASATFVTHFIPLDATGGEPLWDARVRGWGHLASLTQADGPPLLGFGTVDLPPASPPGTLRSSGFVRVGTMDAHGAVLWSIEQRSGMNADLAVHQAIAQYRTALAPFDIDGDGILDIHTPAATRSASGVDQVLITTASHRYDVRSGASGELLRNLVAWGPEGHLFTCGDDGRDLLAVTGHARRIDLTAFSGSQASPTWRIPLWNDVAVRAAATSLETVGVGASCGAAGADRTWVAVNLQAYSFERGHEVVPLLAVLDAAGRTVWQEPPLRGDPPMDSLFSAQAEGKRAASSAPEALLGAALAGALLGLALAGVAARFDRRRTNRPLAGSTLLLVLTLLLPAYMSLGSVAGQPGLATGGSAPSLDDHLAEVAAPASLLEGGGGGDLAAVAGPWTSGGVEQAGALSHRLAFLRGLTTPHGSPLATPGPQMFDEEHAVGYTYDIGDIDGDGVRDVALLEYCVAGYPCDVTGDITDYLLQLATDEACRLDRRLVGLSGADGRPLWSMSLRSGSPIFLTCNMPVVFGTIDLEDGSRGILIYEMRLVHPAAFWTVEVSIHRFHLVDVVTGMVRWTHEEQGHFVTDDIVGKSAENFVVVPVVRSPSSGAVVPGPTTPSLFLWGIGFQTAAASTFIPPPHLGRSPELLDAYQPNEWLARLDPLTGEVLSGTDPQAASCHDWNGPSTGVTPCMSLRPWTQGSGTPRRVALT